MLTLHFSKRSMIQMVFVTIAFLASRRALGIPHTLLLLTYLAVIFLYMGLFSLENVPSLRAQRTWFVTLLAYVGLIGLGYRLWQHVPWLSLHLDSGTLLFVFVVPWIIIGRLPDTVTATMTLIGFAITSVAILMHMPVLAETFSVFTYLILSVSILQTAAVSYSTSK